MMKKIFLRLLTALMVLALLFPVFAVRDEAQAASVPTEAQAYSRMIAMKEQYPEGKPWTNEDFYKWKGGGKYYGGYGCVAFAYILSDAAFGSLPSRYIDDIRIENIHVGDILRINNDTHTVIVLSVNGTESVTIAEGNFNASIHWGRTMTAAQISASSTTELQTRYPEGFFDSHAVKGISLNYTEKTLTRTATKLSPKFSLKAVITPEFADNPAVTWKSSNPKVATVSEKGLVTALRPGKTTITCASVEDPTIKAKCVVTVKNTLVKRITLNLRKKTLSPKKTVQLKAVVKPVRAVNTAVRWVSDNKRVAKVTSKGKVIAVKAGTTIIRCIAKDGSKVYAEFIVTVR